MGLLCRWLNISTMSQHIHFDSAPFLDVESAGFSHSHLWPCVLVIMSEYRTMDYGESDLGGAY